MNKRRASQLEKQPPRKQRRVENGEQLAFHADRQERCSFRPPPHANPMLRRAVVITHCLTAHILKKNKHNLLPTQLGIFQVGEKEGYVGVWQHCPRSPRGRTHWTLRCCKCRVTRCACIPWDDKLGEGIFENLCALILLLLQMDMVFFGWDAASAKYDWLSRYQCPHSENA